MAKLPQGKVIGYVTMSGLLGNGPFITPVEREPRTPDRFNPDHATYYPGNINRRGRGGRWYGDCDGCDAKIGTKAEPFRTAELFGAAAREHDCPPPQR